MTETSTETQFWRYWLFGLLLFAAMIALNPTLSTSVSPMGISDHQTAGTAAKVDSIEIRWTNGKTEIIKDVAADKFYAILEGAGIVSAEKIRPAVKK